MNSYHAIETEQIYIYLSIVSIISIGAWMTITHSCFKHFILNCMCPSGSLILSISSKFQQFSGCFGQKWVKIGLKKRVEGTEANLENLLRGRGRSRRAVWADRRDESRDLAMIGVLKSRESLFQLWTDFHEVKQRLKFWNVSSWYYLVITTLFVSGITRNKSSHDTKRDTLLGSYSCGVCQMNLYKRPCSDPQGHYSLKGLSNIYTV